MKTKTSRTTETAKLEIQEKWNGFIKVPETYKFKNVDSVTTFICKKHGEFERTFYQLMNRRYPCPMCSPTGPKGWKYIEKKLIAKHGNLYDYSLNENDYQHRNKLKIICKQHGIFIQSVGDHLSGCGCPECYKEEKQTTVNDFLLQSITKHGNEYDYRKIFDEYKTVSSKVTIICKKHGEFYQRAADHRNGVGCPWCKNNSKGERIIKSLLDRMKIDFIPQKTFSDCITPRGFPYRFDFYIPKLNIIIEFDGIQHKTGKFMDTIREHKVNFSDLEKDKYAAENGIKMIRINNINDIEKIENMLKFQS